MGAEPYDYVVPYEVDFESALQKLRDEVFDSGAFRGAEFGPSSPEEAMAMMEADGTGSILDILAVGDTPDFCTAAPLTDDELLDYFGTTTPTRVDINESGNFWEDIERGHCRIVVLHEDGQPAALYFAGYSFD